MAVAGSVPWIATFGSWLGLAIVLGLSQVALIGGSYASGVIAAAGGGCWVCCWPGLRTPARRGDRGRDGRLIEVALTVMLVGVAV